MPTHSEGGEGGRWAGNAFLIFCMDTLVTIKILSKGSNFKEEKLAWLRRSIEINFWENIKSSKEKEKMKSRRH